MTNKKLSTETVRFLNHIEREIGRATEPLRKKIDIATYRAEHAEEIIGIQREELERTEFERKKAAEALRVSTGISTALLAASRELLKKLRVNIYTGKTSTPRWFRSGKWWSRETGGLEPEFIAEMTDDEIVEAVEFYANTELPLMLPSSNRNSLAGYDLAQILWSRYEKLTDEERAGRTFPQYVGDERKKAKTEEIEK